MRKVLTILVLSLAALAGGGQEPVQPADCKPIINPEEYNRKGQLKLGRGVDLRLEFDCGKNQITGSVGGDVTPASWPELQAWILEQLERDHPLGQKVVAPVHDSGWAINGRYYRVDKYQNGYMQYATTSHRDSAGNEGSPNVTDFVIFYPHEVTGLVDYIERPHASYGTPGDKPGTIMIHPDVKVSLVNMKEGTFIVSESEAERLKKGEKATFVGYGPLDFWVL
jgi:hypothetical protein